MMLFRIEEMCHNVYLKYVPENPQYNREGKNKVRIFSQTVTKMVVRIMNNKILSASSKKRCV